MTNMDKSADESGIQFIPDQRSGGFKPTGNNVVLLLKGPAHAAGISSFSINHIESMTVA
jgi:hypothetical protein